MKSCLILLVFFSALSLGAADAPSTRELSLANLLTQLHRPGEKGSDIEHPGWRDTNVIQGLSRLAESSTNVDEARTARTWLAAIEFENVQAETRPAEIRRKVDAFIPKLDGIINSDRNSWQAKVARMMKSNALLFARRFDECRAEVASLLRDIASFKSETHPQFIQFLNIQKKAAANLDAEARYLLVIASALEKDWAAAIKQAEEIQQQHPDWSRTEKVDDAVGLLRRGISPFYLP